MTQDSQAPAIAAQRALALDEADKIVALFVELIEKTPNQNAEWTRHAKNLMEAYIPVLVWHRDRAGIALTLPALPELLNFRMAVKSGRDAAIPAPLRARLSGYLMTLPGFFAENFDDEGKDVAKPGADHQTPATQFKYNATPMLQAVWHLIDTLDAAE
ncbi:MAG: hypothetical protein GC185_06980 [Alphaproteobacteria bacterium]|nr:hypothetical protein [Alphaproteobacteria bacterium]